VRPSRRATGLAPWPPPVDGLAESGSLTAVAVTWAGAGTTVRPRAKVTTLVRGEQLARAEEPQVSQVISGVFADEGITAVTGAQLQQVRRSPVVEVTATAVFDGARREFRAEHVPVATGCRPVTDKLNLDAVGVTVGGRAQVVVDGGADPCTSLPPSPRWPTPGRHI